jgi:translocation protein SEC63
MKLTPSHPDKVQLSENQTAEDVEAKFVDLTKAYKALTDEVTRENLAKYGNPDGPQQREDKIAIPQWVVEGKNGIWVLALYGLVLGVGIPWVVVSSSSCPAHLLFCSFVTYLDSPDYQGRWWFSQKSHTRDGILNASAESFFHGLREDTDFSSLVSILASAAELQAIVGGKKAGSKKERKERQSKVEELEKRLEARKEEIGFEESVLMRKDSEVAVTSAAARRVRALLWCQLLRLDPENAEMQSGELALKSVIAWSLEVTHRRT